MSRRKVTCHLLHRQGEGEGKGERGSFGLSHVNVKMDESYHIYETDVYCKRRCQLALQRVVQGKVPQARSWGGRKDRFRVKGMPHYVPYLG